METKVNIQAATAEHSAVSLSLMAREWYVTVLAALRERSLFPVRVNSQDSRETV